MDRGVLVRRAVALFAGAVLLLPSGAAAASVEGQWGTVGAHHLRDGSGKAGGVCRYLSGSGEYDPTLLLTIVVKPPVVFGRTAVKQRVSWRARIQSREFSSSDPWQTILAAHVQYGKASQSAAAGFTAQKFGGDLPAWWFQFPGSDYRVLVDMVWYQGTDPVGGATLRVRHLAEVIDGVATGKATASCWQGGN